MFFPPLYPAANWVSAHCAKAWHEPSRCCGSCTKRPLSRWGYRVRTAAASVVGCGACLRGTHVKHLAKPSDWAARFAEGECEKCARHRRFTKTAHCCCVLVGLVCFGPLLVGTAFLSGTFSLSHRHFGLDLRRWCLRSDVPQCSAAPWAQRQLHSD